MSPTLATRANRACITGPMFIVTGALLSSTHGAGACRAGRPPEAQRPSPTSCWDACRSSRPPEALLGRLFLARVERIVRRRRSGLRRLAAGTRVDRKRCWGACSPSRPRGGTAAVAGQLPGRM
ncbi:hypothetical protein PF011_g16199 [Phytophthora fragariae]|uniref:Uncharacterized protein n=1 Tax=Phytophthora fragariae TaxID=53985 RepID=A0A6A3JU76_9STRA|nr:hypothetical protein PF011_g16199 [Phytophthora fragariae]